MRGVGILCWLPATSSTFAPTDAEEARVGFPQTVLTSDEQVVKHLHPHWKVLIIPIVWLVVAIAAAVASGVFVGSLGIVITVIIDVLALIMAIVLFGMPWLRWRTTHYVFTNERIITRVGVMSRNGRDIPLARVNDVSFSHNVVERMLGCGTLTIESAGERGQIVLANLPKVEQIQSVLYELVEADRDKHSFDDGDRQAIVRDLREGNANPA